MAKLFLLRHLKSRWNKENRFSGWVDNPLSEEGILSARLVAEKLSGLYDPKIDIVYTSPLIRNEETVLRVFEHIEDRYPIFLHLDGGRMQRWGNFKGNGSHIPVYVSESLNERYYGRLQGLNKEETTQKYGREKVRLWRRGFKESPPGGESLKYVYKRVIRFFEKYIAQDLISGKNILIVASHNSLRAVVKYIEDISDKNIVDVELPFGSLVHYDFDDKLSLKSDKYFMEK